MEKWWEFKGPRGAVLALGTKERADRFLRRLNEAASEGERQYHDVDEGVTVFYVPYKLRELSREEASQQEWGCPIDGAIHVDID